MATPPEHQRRGMGRALLSQVVADLAVWVLEPPVPTGS